MSSYHSRQGLPPWRRQLAWWSPFMPNFGKSGWGGQAFMYKALGYILDHIHSLLLPGRMALQMASLGTSCLTLVSSTSLKKRIPWQEEGESLQSAGHTWHKEGKSGASHTHTTEYLNRQSIAEICYGRSYIPMHKYIFCLWVVMRWGSIIKLEQ